MQLEQPVDANVSKQNISVRVDTSIKKNYSLCEAEFIIVGLEVNIRVHDFVHKYNRKISLVCTFEPEIFWK